MVYYYLIPCYLTLVFVLSYFAVCSMLFVFDCTNKFWDKWDDGHRRKPYFFGFIEIAILIAIVAYIIRNVLSGTP